MKVQVHSSSKPSSGIQAGPETLKVSRSVMIFLTMIPGVTGILFNFRLGDL